MGPDINKRKEIGRMKDVEEIMARLKAAGDDVEWFEEMPMNSFGYKITKLVFETWPKDPVESAQMLKDMACAYATTVLRCVGYDTEAAIAVFNSLHDAHIRAAHKIESVLPEHLKKALRERSL